MKKIMLLLFCAMFFGKLYPQYNTLTLENFEIERVAVEERKSQYYQLIWRGEEDNISLRLFGQEPKKITASFFDEKYLVMVYEIYAGENQRHYLIGAYFDGEKWVEDYFQRPLGYITGISSQTVKKATFIDGETLLIEYELFTHMNGGEYSTQHSILRICKDRIYEYNKKEPLGFNNLGERNPIRPID